MSAYAMALYDVKHRPPRASRVDSPYSRGEIGAFVAKTAARVLLQVRDASSPQQAYLSALDAEQRLLSTATAAEGFSPKSRCSSRYYPLGSGNDVKVDPLDEIVVRAALFYRQIQLPIVHGDVSLRHGSSKVMCMDIRIAALLPMN
jgi:hypothetical protein